MFSFSLLTPLGWTYVTLHRWLHRSVQCRWRLGRKWCILLIACWLNGKSLLTRLIWVQDVSSILCTMLVCSANIWRHKSKHETCGSGLTLMRWSKVTLNFSQRRNVAYTTYLLSSSRTFLFHREQKMHYVIFLWYVSGSPGKHHKHICSADTYIRYTCSFRQIAK